MKPMSPAAAAAVNSVSSNSWYLVGHRNQIQHYGHINNVTIQGCRRDFIVKDCNNSKSRSKSYPSLIITTVSTRSTSLHASASSSSSASEQWLDAKPRQRRKRIAGIDQDELLDPTGLADPDSCFCEFNGVHIHHKVYDAESQSSNSLQNQALIQLPQ